MITVLIGENSFEIERALVQITNSFSGDVEKIDGSDLQISQLPDILMGVSLFATARTVVIRDLSSNKSIWSVLGDWMPRISDDIHLILVEPKPDKRTSTFKLLKDQAKIQEFNLWSDRDTSLAEKWLVKEASDINLNLDKDVIQLIIRRVGLDQWSLYSALQKLSLAPNVTADVVKNLIDANPVENVFNLFETALKGDIANLRQMLKILEQSEDVYRLFSLLSTQVFQLAAVSSTSSENVAKDFGIHPYVASKLGSIAKKVGDSGVKKIVKIFASADDDMKISRAEPWLIIEIALIKVANIKS